MAFSKKLSRPAHSQSHDTPGDEREQKPQNEAPSAYFDCTILPDIVAERIASFLDGKDLINLGKTCKFWNYVSQKNFVWRILAEKRFGKQPQAKPKATPLDYKKLYFGLATSKKPAKAFRVVWLNGKYLEIVKDKESEFGEVIQRHSVCWLQIKHRRRQRQRRKTIGLMSKNNRSANALRFKFCSFLCCPLENNVK